MNYEIVNINDKEYKLTLNMANMIQLEKKIGENPLNKLMEIQDDNMPDFEFICTILLYSMKKYQPKIKEMEVYDLIDEYLADEGNDIGSLIQLAFKVFEVSGYFRQPKQPIIKPEKPEADE